MKIIVPALLCLLIGLTPFIPDSLLPVEAVTSVRNIAVPVLALFILLSACCNSCGKPKCDLFASLRKSEYETDEELVKRLSDELESLRAESKILVEGKDTLQAKLQEVLKELKEAKAGDVPMKRDAQIDAELVNLLSILQEKGRLVDFFMDDITAYPDAQVGAAARVVHNGCAKVLKEYFNIKPIHTANEGDNVKLEEGYDTERFRIVGKVGGEPPFSGKLLHHGWIVDKISLPRLMKTGEDLEKHRIVAAAEIELA